MAEKSAPEKPAPGKSVTAFRTISEVADLLETPAHVLRFWESRFPQVRPVKRAGGRRYYRPADVALLAGIRKLLHDDGLAIRGVQKMLRDHGVKAVSAPPETMGPAADTAEALAETPAPADAATPESRRPEQGEAVAAPVAALPAEHISSAGMAPDDLAADAERQAPAESRPPADRPAPKAAEPEAPAPPRVLMRRRAGDDSPGLFSLMDAPEHPRPAPPPPAPPPQADEDGAPAERPLAAFLRAAAPAALAPHADALAALCARLEALRARHGRAPGRGR